MMHGFFVSHPIATSSTQIISGYFYPLNYNEIRDQICLPYQVIERYLRLILPDDGVSVIEMSYTINSVYRVNG